MKFKKLYDGSTFVYNNRPMKKVSNAFSIDLLNGKDVILALNDEVTPIQEKALYKRFNIVA